METGVAKMNTVTVASAVEPHLATTVTNNAYIRGRVGNQVHSSISIACTASVPTMVKNGIIDSGRTNPAGPQLEEEDKVDKGILGGEDNYMNLLNPSPDEHEPLLLREQRPAESPPTANGHHHHQSKPGKISLGQGSNTNNNNNNIILESEVKVQGLEVDPKGIISSEVTQQGGINSAKPEPHLTSQLIIRAPVDPALNLENKILLSDQGKSATSAPARILQAPPTGQDIGQSLHTGPCVQRAFLASVLDNSVKNQKVSPFVASENPAPENLPLHSEHPETAAHAEVPASESEVLQSSALVLQTPGLLRPQAGLSKAKRPERPCSLDLSSSCISSGEFKCSRSFGQLFSGTN